VEWWNCYTELLFDVSEAFRQTKETFGTVDIVVNNAGILDEDHWDRMVDVNVVRNC
jgi:15-hydroxyprostaglandin dehydrogenase (NAD)